MEDHGDMKLRTQFFLLVGGIIAVPFLVSAFTLVMRTAVEREHEPAPNYGEITSWVRRQMPRAIQTNNFQRIAVERPLGLEFVVLDPDDNVRFSTVAPIASGTPAFTGDHQLLDYMRGNLQSYMFLWEPIAVNGEGQSLVILQVPRIRPEVAVNRNTFLQLITYTSIALLVFSSLMAFLILRSLNASIQSLEGATRRIAEGDLDFDLPAKGNDQISSLRRSFDSMRRALKEEYARRARFIMGVSHDLRTPLTLIQGYVEAIADGYAVDPEAQKRYLSIVLDKTRNLEGMVGDLIEFVRMETGQWRMTHRDVALRAFLTETSHHFSQDALILKRTFTSALDIGEEITVRMDVALFTRALENLVGNAIRYTRENAEITLRARQDGSEVVLDISDTGIGIAAEDLTRIYDPFYRGTNSRREQGFGLGLTTVKSIIESHGWSISVASEVGKGSTFTIRMPIGVVNPGVTV
jgi:signal transduction histidine kinase